MKSSKSQTGILKAGNPHPTISHWQGRVAEIQQLEEWLADENTTLAGIYGVGGVGKSTLAAKLYSEFSNKRFWADVTFGGIFSDLARQLLTEFGFPVPEKEQDLVKALVKCLQQGQYLLIIDNLESLLQPDRSLRSEFYEDFFRTWIECGNNSTVLVTTREQPKLRGFEWLNLGGLQPQEGAALLAALGIQGDLAKFAKFVGGHPLLLEMVAGLLKSEYPEDPNLERLADLGLGNLQQLLTHPQVIGQHRKEDVGMVLVLDASFERLHDWQRKLLQNVSVYRGKFDRKAASFVSPHVSISSSSEEPEVNEQDIEQELRKLVKRSWLQTMLEDRRLFEFQPVVLEYIKHKAGEQTEAHQQAINYYRSTAKEENWQTLEDVQPYLEIFYHYFKLKQYDCAFDTIQTCNIFLSWRGYYVVDIDVHNQLITAWQEKIETENLKYSFSLNYLGNNYNALGDYHRAIEFYQQSLEIYRDIGNRHEKANSLFGLGNAYNFLGDYQQAIEFHQQSLEIYRDIGNRHDQARVLQNLTVLYFQMGRIREGIIASNQAIAIYQELELPLDALPFLHRRKSIARFAQKGKLHLALFILIYVVAFPFALVFLTLFILWLLVRAQFRRH